MDREQAEKFMKEFQERMVKLVEKNPRLNPNSLELLALIKEFNDRGMPIRIINANDLDKSMSSLIDLISRLGLNPNGNTKGNVMPSENYPQDMESFETETDPCRFHVKGVDDTNRETEIGKRDVEDLTINLHTMSDEDIWNKYFK